jgi:hypothetical protein
LGQCGAAAKMLSKMSAQGRSKRTRQNAGSVGRVGLGQCGAAAKVLSRMSAQQQGR